MLNRVLFGVVVAIITAMSFIIANPQRSEAADLYNVLYNNISYYSGNGAAECDWIAQAIMYASATYDVDPILIASVMQTESHYHFNSISPVGAIGLMQLMPGTASAVGVDPYDPLGNVIGGTLYLKNMLNNFSGWGVYGVTYAVAAYNAGPQAVYDYGGVPPYPETQDYVIKVNQAYLNLLGQLQ